MDVSAVLRVLTAELAALLGEDPSGTWATWQMIEPALYVEGVDAPAVQPVSTHPPIVEVIAFEGRPPDVVARLLEGVAETLARELQLEPGNVFVRFVEARSGRLYTGGQVATR